MWRDQQGRRWERITRRCKSQPDWWGRGDTCAAAGGTGRHSTARLSLTICTEDGALEGWWATTSDEFAQFVLLWLRLLPRQASLGGFQCPLTKVERNNEVLFIWTGDNIQLMALVLQWCCGSAGSNSEAAPQILLSVWNVYCRKDIERCWSMSRDVTAKSRQTGLLSVPVLYSQTVHAFSYRPFSHATLTSYRPLSDNCDSSSY